MMRSIRSSLARIAAPAALALVLMPSTGRSQGPGDGGDGPDLTIDATVREGVVEALAKALESDYVFPDKGKAMADDLRRRLKEKEYDTVESARAFAKLLAEHVRAISDDKHLRVRYSPEAMREPTAARREPAPEEIEEMRRFTARMNHGFDKVERLDGNIGYIDLRGFMPAQFGGETAAAAMNFVANTEALIIDVRKNGGGDPAMVALVCSYLFGPEPVHLNDLYFRPEDSTHQWWTLPYVPGRRFEGKPVFVLTSNRTFSAAEEFTYNLKNLKRATIIGETTGGGAHPGGVRRLGEHFSAFIPTGRAINPISKTNWEGTGVEPDVPVRADLAYDTAYLAALEKVREARNADPKEPRDERLRKDYDEMIARVRADLERKTQDAKSAEAPSGERPDGRDAP
jgi:hypothetical protein